MAMEEKERKRGGRGMGNRKGVVRRRFERAHHFYRERGEGGGRRGRGG